LELPGSKFEERSHQEPKLEEIKQGSVISSKDHRRFYQAPIDPMDNESAVSNARPMTAQILKKVKNVEVDRPKTAKK